MKKLLLPLALFVAVLATMPVSAGNDVAPFNVDVTLTPACKITTAPGTITLTYTALQATEAAQTTDFGVTCSNGLAYTMALSVTNANTLGLTIPLVIRNSGDTADVTTSQSGTGAELSYKIKATIASGQAGNNCTGAACNSIIARTLTVTY